MLLVKWRCYVNNRSRYRYSRELLLTQIACSRRKCVVGVASDQTNGTDDHDQNHGQHHCVLSNVLAFLLRPELEEKMSHIDTPSEGLHCISPGGLVDGHFDLIRRPEVSIPHSGLVVYRSRRHSAFLRWMPKAPNGWGRECEVGGRQ